jgi:hypothetical protein
MTTRPMPQYLVDEIAARVAYTDLSWRAGERRRDARRTK